MSCLLLSSQTMHALDVSVCVLHHTELFGRSALLAMATLDLMKTHHTHTHTHTHGQSEDSPAVGSRMSTAPLRHTDRKLSEDMMVGRLDGWCLISWTVADRKTRGGRGRRRGACVCLGGVPGPEPS